MHNKWHLKTHPLFRSQELRATGELGDCTVLKLGHCHGYGLALAAGLAEVSSEFVLVVQHDWLFVKDVDLTSLVAAMDSDAAVKYIGMQSLTTLGYARRMQLRYSLRLPPAREVHGLRLVPQLLWYDKPHLCRCKHYTEVVLPEAKMGLRENPERRYGVEQMWPRLLHAEHLEEEHLRYGTFFCDVGAEVVYHLSGRKVIAAPENEALMEGLHGVATETETFTAVAAARTMHLSGLGLPGPKRPQRRFKGHCYLCGQRGHSKTHCSLQTRDEEVLGGLREGQAELESKIEISACRLRQGKASDGESAPRLRQAKACRFRSSLVSTG
ncbi:unnamed protein product [Effrenium voratum]|nr:unnamed protein product [Effrenium voratum]